MSGPGEQAFEATTYGASNEGNANENIALEDRELLDAFYAGLLDVVGGQIVDVPMDPMQPIEGRQV